MSHSRSFRLDASYSAVKWFGAPSSTTPGQSRDRLGGQSKDRPRTTAAAPERPVEGPVPPVAAAHHRTIYFGDRMIAHKPESGEQKRNPAKLSQASTSALFILCILSIYINNCFAPAVKHSLVSPKSESGEIFSYRIQRNSPPPSGAFHPSHPVSPENGPPFSNYSCPPSIFVSFVSFVSFVVQFVTNRNPAKSSHSAPRVFRSFSRPSRLRVR